MTMNQAGKVYEDQKLYTDGFKAGYAQAIGDADAALRKRGDDFQTRFCRRDVLALANVSYDPHHAMPQPDWSKHSGKEPTPYTPPRTSLPALAPFARLDDLPDNGSIRRFFENAEVLAIAMPRTLHAETKRLIQAFAVALADKAREAEVKHDFGDDWLSSLTETGCRLDLLKHLEKGDPRDVALYCAFMWARGWATKGAL